MHSVWVEFGIKIEIVVKDGIVSVSFTKDVSISVLPAFKMVIAGTAVQIIITNVGIQFIIAIAAVEFVIAFITEIACSAITQYVIPA